MRNLLLMACAALLVNAFVRPARGQGVSALGPNVAKYVTATMDGTYAWYEQGFNPNAPLYGLPPAGIVQSPSNPNYSFLLQPYDGNNVLLLNSGDNTGTMTLATPTGVNSIAFATATGVGPAYLTPTFHFSDGTPDYAPLLMTVPDWYQGTGPYVASSSGRVQIFPSDIDGVQSVAGTFDIGPPRISIQTIQFPQSVAFHPISSVTFAWSTQQSSPYYTPNTAIFGISTSTDDGASYVPAQLTAWSFNQDVVVEAAALPEPAQLGLVIVSCTSLLRRRRS